MAGFVMLCRCTGPIIAQRLQALLEAEGIAVRIEGNHADTIFGGLMSATGIRVLVPEDRLVEAERLVDALSEGELDDDVAEADNDADESNRDGRDDHEDDEVDEQPRDRLSSMMRWQVIRWSWPIWAIVGVMRLFLGQYQSGAIALLFAFLAWVISRPSGDDPPGRNR